MLNKLLTLSPHQAASKIFYMKRSFCHALFYFEKNFNLGLDFYLQVYIATHVGWKFAGVYADV